MTETTALKATPRDIIGHANQRLSGENQIPAVVYGAGRDSAAVAVDRHEFETYVQHHGHTGLVELALEGEDQPVNVVIRDIQYAAVKGNVIHVDFLAVKMDQTIQSTVPLRLTGEPTGVRSGGTLTVNIHEVNVEALPADLPDAIEFDVDSMEIGDSIHLSDMVIPAGVRLLDDVEQIVASVQAARAEEVEEVVAAEEEAEPEVIGAKPEEE